MFANCGIDGIEQSPVEFVVELAPELKLPGRMIASAPASRHGQAGWIALDGPRSRWYSALEMPDDTSAMSVLMIHVGRALIGFTEEPDRRRYLKPDSPAEPAPDSDEDD